MRAAVIKQHGNAESIQFENRPIPALKEDEVLVRVKALGLNHLDLWVRRGVPGHKFPLPLVPGSDFTGLVDKVGSNVRGFKPGDRVIINPGLYCGQCPRCHEGLENLCPKWGLLGETKDGGCQEYTAVPERQCAILPENLSFEEGACIPINFVTAWQMLIGKAQIKAGQTILIHGAGSGVSVACLQIAKNIGLKTFITSTSAEKLAHAKQLGADVLINTKQETLRDVIKQHTSKEGVDVVVDHVGVATFMDSIRSLRIGGKLVSCGATSGADLTINWQYVFFKNIALLGSTYGTTRDFSDVLAAFKNAKLKAIVDQTLPFNELAKAHQLLENRQIFGKIVLKF